MHHIESNEQLNELFFNTVCVVDFYANWCGPCKQISPFLEQLSNDFDKSCTRVNICKVNVDFCPEVAELYKIEALPTILVFNNGHLVKKFEGVSPTFQKDLVHVIETYM